VIFVSLTNSTLLAAVEPNETALLFVKPEPVMVTFVPPAAGPLAGLMPDTDEFKDTDGSTVSVTFTALSTVGFAGLQRRDAT
jgi:hypothetical protein